MRNENLHSVIRMLKQSISNPEMFHSAATHFHNLMWEEILGTCKKVHRKFHNIKNRESEEDLAQEIMLRFWKRVVDIDEQKFESEAALRREVVRRIYTMSKTYLIDIIRANNKTRNHVEAFIYLMEKSSEIYPNESTGEDTFIFPKDMKGFRIRPGDYESEITNALNRLSHKKREVVLFYRNYHPEIPPQEELELLAQKLKVKTDSLRVIKKRALEELKTFLDIKLKK